MAVDLDRTIIPTLRAKSVQFDNDFPFMESKAVRILDFAAGVGDAWPGAIKARVLLDRFIHVDAIEDQMDELRREWTDNVGTPYYGDFNRFNRSDYGNLDDFVPKG